MVKTTKARLDDARETIRPTVIELILDETGSMSCYKSQTITGYNTFITEQREQPGQCLFTLTKFDTSGERTPFVDLDLQMVIPMTNDTFCPNASTNLRDALGHRVRALEERLASWTVKPNVVVILMTDGDDNASREYGEHNIRDMIKAKEAEGWTFVFLGACPGAQQSAARLGFQPGNTKQFEGVDMEQTMTTLSQATTVYRTAVSNSETFAATSYFG